MTGTAQAIAAAAMLMAGVAPGHLPARGLPSGPDRGQSRSSVPSMPVVPAPQPGILQYNGDWAVGCDNLVRCEAIALQPDASGGAGGQSSGAGSDDESMLLEVARDGGPAGEVTLRVSGLSQLPAEIVLMVDGQESLRLTGTTGDEAVARGTAALATAQAMAAASTIELRPALKKGRAGPLLASFSSAGLADSLRFVDARQGRVGTQGALISRGAEPDTGVPMPPPRPMVRQVPSPDADAAPSLSEAELAAARKLAVCDAMLMARDVKELFPLDGQAALLLLPCEAGAYNVSAVPLIARGQAGSRTLSIAHFDFAPGFTGEPGKPPLVVNALWDSRRGVLSSLAKGRGIGDCGASEDYVWDGTTFRLIESRAMHVCRGAWEWIRLWEAQPQRAAAAPTQTAATPGPVG